MFRERLKNPNMPYLAKKGLKKKILGIHTRFSGHTVLFLEKVSVSIGTRSGTGSTCEEIKSSEKLLGTIPQNKSSVTGYRSGSDRI